MRLGPQDFGSAASFASRTHDGTLRIEIAGLLTTTTCITARAHYGRAIGGAALPVVIDTRRAVVTADFDSLRVDPSGGMAGLAVAYLANPHDLVELQRFAMRGINVGLARCAFTDPEQAFAWVAARARALVALRRAVESLGPPVAHLQ